MFLNSFSGFRRAFKLKNAAATPRKTADSRPCEDTRKLEPRPANSVAVVAWRITQWFDVLGAPVMVAMKGDGTEFAIDYSDFPRCAQVPIEWVRAFGGEIDRPRWLGLILAHRFRDRAPVVGIGHDGTAFIVTPKATVTRIGGKWKRGYWVPTSQRMNRVDAGMEELIAESQRALRPRRMQTEVERVGPRTQVLTAGHGRTIVIDEDGARSHVGDRWLPGIHFTPDVIASMRRIVDPSEQIRHLKFVASSDAMALALLKNLNAYVTERHGGIDEENLPGFPRSSYSDSEIDESKRQAAAIIAKAAAR
jgi:hypothetical protein